MTINYKQQVYLVVFLIFILDFITKTCVFYNYTGFIRYGGAGKLCLLIFFFCSFVVNGVKNKAVLVYPLVLVFSFFIGQLFLISVNTNKILIEVTPLIKYLYLFGFVIYMKGVKNESLLVKHLQNSIIILGVVNSLVIIVALIGNIELFKSYPFSGRFGFNGIFARRSESSYIYIILISLCYYKFIITKLTKHLILCCLFSASALLLGTKACWFFLLMLILLHTIRQHKRLNKKKVLGIIVGLVSILYLLRDLIKNCIIGFFPYGKELYSEGGFISLLLSKRDVLLGNTLDFVGNNWRTPNYLFGGISYYENQTELEFFDIYFFFGLLGIVVYLSAIKTLFLGKKPKFLKLGVLIIIMFTAFLAGNLFTSVICCSYLYILMKVMDKNLIGNETNSTII